MEKEVSKLQGTLINSVHLSSPCVTGTSSIVKKSWSFVFGTSTHSKLEELASYSTAATGSDIAAQSSRVVKEHETVPSSNQLCY